MKGFMIDQLQKRFDNVVLSLVDSLLFFFLSELMIVILIHIACRARVVFFIRKLFIAYEGEYLSESNNYLFSCCCDLYP